MSETVQILRDRLIVALDHPEAGRNEALVETIGDRVRWYKVGLMAFVRRGPTWVEALKGRGKRVFLDLKFHDIPSTVAAAVDSACRLRADLCTVHSAGGEAMLRAAVEAAAEHGASRTRVLAVTLLTSVAAEDARARVVAAAELAQRCGCDGVICSPQEASEVRAACGVDFTIVTPGIRFGQGHGDQARVATPSDAIAAGASHIVVGRPIHRARDPSAALDEIARDLRSLG